LNYKRMNHSLNIIHNSVDEDTEIITSLEE